MKAKLGRLSPQIHFFSHTNDAVRCHVTLHISYAKKHFSFVTEKLLTKLERSCQPVASFIRSQNGQAYCQRRKVSVYCQNLIRPFISRERFLEQKSIF